MKTEKDIQPQDYEKYMRRALQLAANGAGRVSPNPQAGAVIVAPDGRIIGEGWHREYGQPHAEVNAFASISSDDEHLIGDSTIFVTLEPCSHYGKTPPCALLLKEKGIRRAVIGTGDPTPKVAGRGLKILRDAGIEVVEHVLEPECRAINRRFFTAQTLRRPWIQLKWAESADGFIAAEGGRPVALSTPVTLRLMHRERAMADAIIVGTDTWLNDNPSLTVRHWPGRAPKRVMFSSPRIPEEAREGKIILDPDIPLKANMERLFSEFGITSLMVEGGAKLLGSFIKVGLYDEIRRERSSVRLGSGIKAPALPGHALEEF